jgi:purine-binding chemotaxis protein CheW
MNTGLSGRAASLRENFDRGFAAPRQETAAALVDFLAISVGTAPYAIRLADIAALSNGHNVTAIPGQPAALLGLAGVRGVILPVYGLAALLNHDTAMPAGWLVRAPPVAFAFSRFEGLLRLPASSIVPPPATHRHLRGFLEHGAKIRPVLDMPALFESVRILADAMGAEAKGKEQNQA